MKRWNGWGDETVAYPLTGAARDYLRDEIGEGEIIPDARLEDVLARIPEANLPAGPGIATDREDRLRHARGQSLPDWVGMTIAGFKKVIDTPISGILTIIFPRAWYKRIMSLTALLSHWRSEPELARDIAEWREIPERQPQYARFPAGLHPAMASTIQDLGYHSLYSHQLKTWQLVNAGENPVIVTGTASGKTLAYNIPVIERLLRDPAARALYIFPTKALAQDQLRELYRLVESVKSKSDSLQFSIPVGVYDGDTPVHTRPAIRSNARLVISNPDMIHAGILPHHTQWAAFFENLQIIVLDEMHIYRGVFGSHVANVIRRLKRIAGFYGAKPQFVLTTATIANPAELATRLVEEPVTLVDEDGSSRGSKHFLVYNPPVVNRDLGIRRSALLESVRLAEDLLKFGVQTIIFGRSRRSIEIILSYLRQVSGDDSTETIRGYRSGYLPQERREIELGLRQGKVRAVVATNALELGIDIGGMGASLLVGYPGTIASTWQQAGRAGRSKDTSLTILVATANPLDQFLAHHPEYFFSRSPEQGLINPDNLLILLNHLRCAVFELPFKSDEPFGEVSGEKVGEFLEFLEDAETVHESRGKYFWMADAYPAEGVSLRSASPDRVLLQNADGEKVFIIGEIDLESAHRMVHPGAVYIHEAQTYFVEGLDLEQKVAALRPTEVDYYTEPRVDTTIRLIQTLQEKDRKVDSQIIATIAHGEIAVTSQVTGYRKVKWYTHEQLGMAELSLPPTQLNTTGYWLALSEESIEKLRAQNLWTGDPIRYGPNWLSQKERARARDGYRCQVCQRPEDGRAHDVHHKIPFRRFSNYLEANRLDNLVTLCPACHQRAEAAVRMRSGLAGVSYVLGNLAPFFLMCDSRDLGVQSDPKSPLTDGRPTVVLYDLVPAGIGFSQSLYESHDDLILRAYELVVDCECADGCPSCTGPAGESGDGGKIESLAILKCLLGLDP